ncbi:MAG: ABC-F family ATP-binding cassette domain-containing protein [Proteobacteria bacterium]|nr:ABC-F family ATP-binding cassette domain-containing protein [Pseudomonadota bacterium]
MIRIDDLKKSFGTKAILDKVSYHFPEGERLALVGANGAGKTTLLNILTGVEEADGGTILKPARLRLGYLPQEANTEPEEDVLTEAVSGGEGYMQALYRSHRDALHEMTVNYSDKAHHNFERVDFDFNREGGYAMESEAKAVLRGLGFSDEMLEVNPRTLSGGWRMRLELAKIFVNRPNFLILDEPTNHLDLPSLIWVERWLQSYQGTLLFVSHDRSLLERLPTMTLHMNLGRFTSYKGNFSSFLEQRELRLAQDASTADSLKRRREHLQSFVDRFGAKATKAAQAQSRVKMIARIRDMEDSVPSDDTADSISLTIPMAIPSGREVLKIVGGSVGYDKVLAKNVQLLVEKGQRIAVIGANGIGKSTLLKTIAGVLSPKSGTFTLGYNVVMGWFAQDQLDSLELNKTLMYNVLQASAQTSEREARSLLGSLLFRGEDVFKNVGVLSGGEKARVGLARLLAQRANFLVMDEPTNHLDLSSVEILVEALQEYPGTLLFVSHDRNFIDSVCTHVFVMLPDGRSQVFVGKLEDYQRLAKVSGFPDVLDPAPDQDAAKLKSKPDAESKAKPKQATPIALTASFTESEIMAMKRDLQKHERRIAELDKLIAVSHRESERIEAEMANCHGDFEALAKLNAKKIETETGLVTLEEEWLTVSEPLESIRASLKSLGIQ